MKKPDKKVDDNIAALTKIEPTQQEFISNHTKQAKEFLQRLGSEIVVADDKDFLLLSDTLGFIKKCLKQIEENRKKVTQPLNQALKEFRKWYKPPETAYKALEVLIKRALVSYELERAEQKRQVVEQIAAAAEADDYDAAHEASLQLRPDLKSEGLTISQYYTYEVRDLAQVPEQFKTIDHNAVIEYIREAKPNKPADVPGLEFVLTGTAIKR